MHIHTLLRCSVAFANIVSCSSKMSRMRVRNLILSTYMLLLLTTIIGPLAHLGLSSRLLVILVFIDASLWIVFLKKLLLLCNLILI